MFFYNEGDSEVSQIQTPSIVTEGLQLHLDAADPASYPGTGNTWYDLSGNGNNFILFNSPTFSTGKITFNGTDQYARSQNIVNLSSTQAVSIFSFWKMNNSDPTMVYEFGPNWNTNSGAFGLAANVAYDSSNNSLNGSTYCHVISKGNTGINGKNIITDDTNTANIFTVIHDFAQPGPTETTVYDLDQISANQPGLETYEANNTGYFGNYHLYLASRGGLSTFSNVDFYGILIYDRVLSQEEVTQNFNATKDRFGL